MIRGDTLDLIPGLTREGVISHIGQPPAELSDAEHSYLLYRGSWKYDDAVALPAPWFLLVPFVVAGTTGLLEDMARGQVCYRVVIDGQRIARRVDIKSADSSECFNSFWTKGELKTIETNLRERATNGDVEAARQIAVTFDDSQPLSQLEEDDFVARAIWLDRLAYRTSAPSKYPEAGLGENTDHYQRKGASAKSLFRAYRKAVPPSPLVWLCRAADHGHPTARYELGKYFAESRRNVSRALMWYGLSASTGSNVAVGEARALAMTATNNEIRLAESLISSWQPGQCEKEMAEQ